MHDVLRSAGQPLDERVRGFMEPRFGHDFSRVRVHADRGAAVSARAVGALAYTVGEHVAFASGRYAPGSADGRRLIAHELTHVVQQGGSAAASGPLRVGEPDDADEAQAEVTAQRVAAGGANHLPSMARTPILQRAVREGVTSDIQPGARACLVHLHGDEQNALETARSLRGSHCVNLVHLTSSTRHIHVQVPSGGATVTCLADPNRIFSAAGISGHAIQSPCGASVRSAVESDLVQFRDHQLGPAIRQCRGGSGGSGVSGPLPVVALHNNTTPGGLAIGSYRRGGGEAGATETDPARTGGVANPTIVRGEDPDDFFLVTDPADFAALRAIRNTVLQAHSPTADGSLSVALAGERYINVEAQGKTFVSNTDRFFVTNQSMGQEVLRHLGVSEQPCALETQGQGGSSPVQVPRETGGTAGTDAETEQEGIVDWIRRFIREILRVLEQVGTMPAPLEREAPPANLPRGCRTFNDQADLDARKAHWTSVIGALALPDVIGWIVGTSTPPSAPTSEADAQKDCMLFAIRAGAARPGSGITLPTGSLTHSSHRSFAQQRAIWNRKFEFRGAAFDRITDQARRDCGSLISASDTRWDPSNPAHRVCWGVAPLAGTTPPPVPAGARALTADERQREILQASSAPGISRHHWGTDFDLFDPDMNPAEWEAGRPFADEYSWLMRNAATYGFIQSFSAFSTFMRIGYIEERWHWSYYPVAQGLLEFARGHESDVDGELLRQWGTRPQFSFIRSHWRDFMFNVSERGTF